MEFGWAEHAPRVRSRLPNLNLLPAELLPVPLPWLTAGLVLLASGLVMLLYALFYMRSYTDLEIAAYRDRLTNAEQTARQLGLPIDQVGPSGARPLPPGTLEDWAELKARQINWPALFTTIAGGTGPAVNVSGVTQTGYTLSVAGDAGSSADANGFLQRLRDSGLFASLEMSITGEEPAPTVVATALTAPQSQVTAVPNPQSTAASSQQPSVPSSQPPFIPSAQSTIPPPPPPPPGGFQSTNPTPRPPPTQVPLPTQPSLPTQPPPTLAPRTPLATPSPLGTPPTAAATQGPIGTPTVAPTNTPSFDFVLLSKRETVDPNAIGNNSAVRVRVIDTNGQLVPGLRARIESQGDPPWAAELPRDGDKPSAGTFEFPVGMGKFTVFLLNGYSERATDLFTGVQGQPGVHVWDVTYRKATSATPAAGPTCPNCTPLPTPTPTVTVAPTATPISFGRNVAPFACVSASANGGDAFKAVDGDTGSGWDSGNRPVQQFTLDFMRDPSQGGCVRQARDPSGARSSYLVEAIELVSLMSGGSKQTIELWAMFDDGTSGLLNTFTDVDTNDNQTLSFKLGTPRAIRILLARTVRSTVNVGWREIRIFEPLPPALGTWTATVTPTGVTTPVPTSQVPTPTAPQISAQSLSASSQAPSNPPERAADSNLDTFWRPVSGDGSPQIQFNLSSAQVVTTVRFTASFGDGGTTTPTNTPASGTAVTGVSASYQIVLVQPSVAAAQAQRAAAGRTAQDVEVNCGVSHLINQDGQTIQDSCGTTGNVFAVRIKISGLQGGALPGVREMSVYGSSVTNTPTLSPTVTPTGTITPTATTSPTLPPGGTLTAAAIQTATALSCQTLNNCTPTGAATATETVTPTLTTTPTTSAAASATVTVTPTRTLTPSDASSLGSAFASSAATPTGTGTPFDASLATDLATPGAQNAQTYWWAASAPGPTGTQQWGLTFTSSTISVSGVRGLTFMPRTSTGSITMRLVPASGTPVVTVLVSSTPVTNNQTVQYAFTTPVAEVATILLDFTGFDQAPGLRTFTVSRPAPAARSRASTEGAGLVQRLLARLIRPFASVAPRPAYAEPFEQGYPGSGVVVVPTSPIRPGPQPPGSSQPPPGSQSSQSAPQPPVPPTATVIPPPSPFIPVNPPGNSGFGAPNQPPVSIPPGLLPAAQPTVARDQPPAGPPGGQPSAPPRPLAGNPFAPAAAGTQPQGVQPAQPAVGQPAAAGAPRGRVSFLIIAQVRPGTP